MDRWSHWIATCFILVAFLLVTVVIPLLSFLVCCRLPRVPQTRRHTAKDEQVNEDGDGGVGYKILVCTWRSALQLDAAVFLARPRPRITRPSLIRDGATCLRQKDEATKVCYHALCEVFSCRSAFRLQLLPDLFPRGWEICSRSATDMVHGGVVLEWAAVYTTCPHG